MLVRDATIADSEAIALIHVNTWKIAYKGQLPDDLLNTLSIAEKKDGWEKIITERTPNEYVLVTECKGEVVGWCSGGSCRDENLHKKTGELYGIYVKHDCFGKGVGTALMNTMLKRLQHDGYDRVTLWTLVTNNKSHDFYKRQGWKKLNVFKKENRKGFILHEVQFEYVF